jgi:beta-galactosidase
MTAAAALAAGPDRNSVQADSADHSPAPRRVELLDSNWRFAPAVAPLKLPPAIGDIAKDPPAAPDFPDASWRIVQLPHDYIVEGKYSPSTDANHGFLPVYPAWYRKDFQLQSKDLGRSIWVDFGGVYRDAHVYVNGHFLGRHQGGYTPFRFDITRYANYGGENVLAVYVDPREFEGWWYEGGGIYRHVHLTVADHLHIAPWGVYVISNVHNVRHDPSAELTIETRVINAADQMQHCTVISKVQGPDKTIVDTASSNVSIAAQSEAHLNQTAVLPHAELWSLDTRNLYTLITEIHRNGEFVDRHVQVFGVRTLRFDADEGFFLNELPVKIHGTCNHQDFPGVGIAAPDSLWYWRVRKLKALGCNAIHCTKNVMADALYNACDELGMLVMDENRRLGDTYHPTTHAGDPYQNTRHVEEMVRRDRNHPSVVIWSLCNDEHLVQDTAYGAKAFQALKRAVLRHDRTRPISCSMSAGGKRGRGWDAHFTHLHGFAIDADIAGVDFDPFNYDRFHAAFPKLPMLAGEIGSNTSDRGIYINDPAAGFIDARHGDPAASWRPVAMRKYMAGGFVWTGFDFRGEPVPYKWPCINSHFGILDMCGFPKDNAMYYQAWWKLTPLVHIFPHWNWPGHEGKNISVWCYSNCDEVGLRLNGRTLSRNKMPRYGHLQWNVPYQAGVIEAVGYKNKAIAAIHRISTTGAPAALVLTPDRKECSADGVDIVPVAIAVVDAAGQQVPTANNRVQFRVAGAGTIAGVANGDPSCHEPNQGNYRSAFNGLCMVLVRTESRAGIIHVNATSAGLKSAIVRLHAMPQPRKR